MPATPPKTIIFGRACTPNIAVIYIIILTVIFPEGPMTQFEALFQGVFFVFGAFLVP